MSGGEAPARVTASGRALCSHQFVNKRGGPRGHCSAVAGPDGLCARHSAEARSGLPSEDRKRNAGESSCSSAEEAEPELLFEAEDADGSGVGDSEAVTVAGFRGQLAADLVDRYAEVMSGLLEAAGSSREAFSTCPACGKRHPVVVADWTARTNALRLLIEQGFGRPKEAVKPFELELGERLLAAGQKPIGALSDADLELLVIAPAIMPRLEAEVG